MIDTTNSTSQSKSTIRYTDEELKRPMKFEEFLELTTEEMAQRNKLLGRKECVNVQDSKESKHRLIYVSLKGPWFFINGEKNLKFKTRGNNELDLFNALARYNVDYWESDFKQCVEDMATLLLAQAEAKHKVNEVTFKPGIFKPTDIKPFSFKGVTETE